jgi:branched-subunit amino acid aminotransferase/4-amino-4-deoxychorismate lyase
MQASADALGFGWNEAAVRDLLAGARIAHTGGPWRLRLMVDRTGRPTVSCTPHQTTPSPWRLRMAADPVDSANPMLRHKTTDRRVYTRARDRCPGADDVLLVNERGEATESTVANIVAELDGLRATPPVSCGLLPGVLRAELLERGEIVERALPVDDLRRAPRLWLINSLRGWIDATIEWSP